VTLPDRMWEALRLDPATVAARARFYRAYAELEETPFDVRDVAELLRHSPVEVPGPRVVNLMGLEANVVGERLREIHRPAGREPWVRLAETADALRNAAIAELLLDTQTGRATLLEAGRRYRQLGLPFGDFLVVAAVGDRERTIDAARQLDAVLSDSPIRGAGLLGPTAPATPTQQRYLLFTAARDAADLWPRLTEAPQAHRTLAVGATSQPFSTWWRLGSLLSHLEPRAEGTRRDLARIIAELAEAHSRQLQLATADDHHWSTGRAQTDLIDLDLAGAVAISVRIMGQREIRPWHFESDFPALSPLARISLQIGLHLGHDDPPPDDYFGIGPHDPSPGPLDDVVRRAVRRDTDYE
jgi:hypothetical protein